MKATTVRLPDAEVRITIEADPQEMAEAREAAYRRLAPRTAVPGFRPGKAPRPMIEQQIGSARLYNEAVDDLLPALYRKALEQESIRPYSEGQVKIAQADPLIFDITFPVMPTVTLGDYKSIRLAKPVATVEESEVDEVIERMREENAEWIPPAEPRAVQLGDRVVVDLKGTAGEVTFLDRAGLDVLVSEERTLVVPGLATEVVGAAAEEEKRATLPLPETFSVDNLRGQQAEFVFKVHEIKEKHLPAVDDEFAKSAGNAASLDELRGTIRERLLAGKQNGLQDQYEDDLIAAVAAVSQVEYPLPLVEEEIDHMVHRVADRARESGFDLETYLRMSHKSMADYRAELNPDAHRRIRTALVLGELARVEGMQVDAAEVQAEIDRLVAGASDGGAKFRQDMESEGGRRSVSGMLMERKTYARLVEIASGEPAATSEEPAPEEPPASGQ